MKKTFKDYFLFVLIVVATFGIFTVVFGSINKAYSSNYITDKSKMIFLVGDSRKFVDNLK